MKLFIYTGAEVIFEVIRPLSVEAMNISC